MLPIFVSLSENDKRLILALFLVLILVFVLIGYLGMLIIRIMKWQGKRLDNAVADVLTTRVITTKKPFIKYARKKNWRMYFKESWIPILILLTSATVLIVRDAIQNDFTYNPFNNENGFGTLLFLWDFGNDAYYSYFFNIKLLSSWPGLTNTPHFVLEALPAYITIIGGAIGGLWYLWALQSVIARTIRMYRLSRTVFDKNLDNFNTNGNLDNMNVNQPIPPQNPPETPEQKQ